MFFSVMFSLTPKCELKPVVLQSHPNKCIVEDYIELKDCLCERFVYRFDCSFVLFFRICLL